MISSFEKVYSTMKLPIQRLHYQTILVTSPLELLHVDYTSIEMTMELDQLPHIVNILVFCDHFTRHIMVYVTPDQTAKTVAKILWQGYISIFGALVKLLGD